MPPERILLYTARFPIRWSDMDAFGHVNNSRYFTYFEEARVAWLGTLDAAWSGEAGPVLASTRCDYKRPITFPATLRVHLLTEPPGRSSFKTYYEVYCDDDPGTLYALGEATVVWVDLARGRPVSLPEALRHALTQPTR